VGSKSAGKVRTLTRHDVPAVLDLVRAANWNQTTADIEMLLRLAPDGCFGIECEGQLAAATTLLPVGSRIAWLGMVLTADAYRRRGFARRLVERALDHAARLGISTVKLDATDMGRPLYADLCFRDEQPIERWAGHARQIRPGTDRVTADTPLLRELVQRSEVFSHEDAYLLIRPGMRARYIGPFIAPTPRRAEHLIGSAIEKGGGDLCFWDVLPVNKEAVRLLEQLGFERVRSLVRMVRGLNPPRPDEHKIYAISGFELG
jgi:GNAT superfamily N-acetyltransferase